MFYTQSIVRIVVLLLYLSPYFIPSPQSVDRSLYHSFILTSLLFVRRRQCWLSRKRLFAPRREFCQGEGILLEVLARGVPPGSPNPEPISDQNIPFSHPFSDWPLKSILVFRPKQLKNHTLWGVTYLYSLYRGVGPEVPC